MNETTTILNSLIDKMADAFEDKGRAEQRAAAKDNELFAKLDEIRTLKEKLSKHEPVPGFPVPYVAHQLTADEKIKLIVRMVNHFNGGEKINAIKVCRELTGAGLKEAKDCVEAFVAPAPIANATVAAVENLIRLVVKEPEGKIAIIKEVRTICGIGLKEAKDAVEYSMTGTWDSRYLGAGQYVTTPHYGGRW